MSIIITIIIIIIIIKLPISFSNLPLNKEHNIMTL